MNVLTYRLFICCSIFFSTIGLAQPNPEKTMEINSRILGGARHWYNIRNAENLVNPVKNQPRFEADDYRNIADNILLFQRNNGGWPKNYDMRAILTPAQKDTVLQTKNMTNTTFDNGATYPHIYYLAQVYTATGDKKYKDGCIKGFEYILKAQYDNGGWPQYYPIEENDYSRRITFNDGAYLGIMELLQKVVKQDANFAFIPGKLRKKITQSYDDGLNCILKMQIVDRDQLTVWCQQHNEIDLSPAWARAFEPPSICNKESADVVLFLMDIENPSHEIIRAIQGAVKWFKDSKIYNTRVEWIKADTLKTNWTTITSDRIVVEDPSAPPIWARFYELGTHRPLFCDRNSKYLYSMMEVSRERRVGYAWYTDAPQNVLDRFKSWQQKWAPNENVLN